MCQNLIRLILSLAQEAWAPGESGADAAAAAEGTPNTGEPVVVEPAAPAAGTDSAAMAAVLQNTAGVDAAAMTTAGRRRCKLDPGLKVTGFKSST